MIKPKKLSIRRFQDKDAISVSKIIRNTLMRSNIKDYPISILKPLHDYFTPSKLKILASERYCLITILENKVVATGAYEEGELKTVFVLPKHQGKGIGTQLILELEKQAKKEDVKTMKVPASISAVLFYKELGYIKGETFISQHAGKQTWMEKEL